MSKLSHADLVCRAQRWLKSVGCRVVLTELVTSVSETPDAIGWRSGISILIECKTSKADFLKDKKKWFRRKDYGMGNWRFYLCEPGIIKKEDINDTNWGLLHVNGKRIKKVYGIPQGNCLWAQNVPFKANLQNEVLMLVSALARRSG